jgi:hypothetical protein
MARSPISIPHTLDALVDRHVVLDLHPVADDDVLVHEDVLAQHAGGPDHRAPAHLAVMPDRGALPTDAPGSIMAVG